MAFTLTACAFTGFAGQYVAHGFDGGVALAFTACAFAGLTGKGSGCGAGTNSEDGDGHGDFIEVEHDKYS